jgi:hypothetical protein
MILTIFSLLLFVLIQKVTKKSRNPETRYAQTAGFRLDSKFVQYFDTIFSKKEIAEP